MEKDKPATLPSTRLRLLTAVEMQGGLSGTARGLLEIQTSSLHLRRSVDLAKDLAREVEAIARRAAAQSLSDGRPAFLKVDGIDGIVRQMPGGSRDLVEIIDGQVVVVRPFPATGE